MWDWAENQVNLFLVRHGATDANKEHRYLGKTEESLSDEGIKALEREIKAGSYPKADYVFSSPMKRCLETAKILYPFQEIVMISEWEEIDFGVFEGKNYGELKEDFRYQAWIDSNGTLPFPEGESREAFLKRCEQGFYHMLSILKEYLKKSEKKEVDICLVVHGGTIMSLLSMFYGGDYFDYQTANGHGYSCKLEWDGRKVRLEEVDAGWMNKSGESSV